MPLEFSDYIETRLPADVLTGLEKLVISQDGESVECNINDLADFIGTIIATPAGTWIHRGDWGGLPALPSPSTAFSTYRITVAGNIDFGLGDENVPVGSLIGSLVPNPSVGSDFFLL